MTNGIDPSSIEEAASISSANSNRRCAALFIRVACWRSKPPDEDVQAVAKFQTESCLILPVSPEATGCTELFWVALLYAIGPVVLSMV